MRSPPSLFLALVVLGVAARAVEMAIAAGLGVMPWGGAWVLAPPTWLGASIVDAAGPSLIVVGLARMGMRAPARVLAVLSSVYLAAQPALYRLFQAPLTGDQLRLVGTMADLVGSVAVATPGWAWPLMACAAAVGVVAGIEVPRSPSPKLLAFGTLAVVGWAVAPAGFAAGSERSALAALVPSPSGPAPTLGPSPQRARVPFTPPLPVEDTSTLVTEGYPRSGANVVLWALESTSRRLMDFDGPRFPEIMPSAASLAAEGVSFDRYYAITPVSMKSLVSMTCSVHPYPRAEALTYVNPTLPCADLSSELGGRGWRTGLFHAGHFHYSDKDRFFRARGYEVLLDADPIRRKHGGARNAWGVDDASMVDAAVAWLATLSPEDRFFLMVIPVTPHHPYRGEGPFPAATSEGRYRNALHAVDAQIGRLRQAIEAKWPAESTLHVLAGDHGEAFGEHPGHTMHGSYVYEEAVRVPLILSNPSMFRGGARSARIGNHVDLAPTVLEALGLEIPERHEGVPLLQGFRPHVVHFFTQYAHHQLGLRDGRWKYILDLGRGSEQVFDLETDPGETRNLIGVRRALADRWRTEVHEWEGFHRALIPHYEAHWFPDRACSRAARCALSELTPAFAHGRWIKDRSARRKPLRAGGRVWPAGLGVAAPSILRWSIQGLPFRHLRGAVAHDDDIFPGQLAAWVSAEIYVDGVQRFHSGKLTRGDAPRPFDVDLEGAKTLELFAHDMDGLQYRNLVDWLDVRLER